MYVEIIKEAKSSSWSLIAMIAKLTESLTDVLATLSPAPMKQQTFPTAQARIIVTPTVQLVKPRWVRQRDLTTTKTVVPQYTARESTEPTVRNKKGRDKRTT